MANDLLTVADLVANSMDVSDAQVSDLLIDSPLVALLPVVDSSNKTVHKYSKETGAPVVGFRAETLGRDIDHSEDTLVTVNLKILDFSWFTDKAVADADKNGPEVLIDREGKRQLRAAFFKAEQQYLNGTISGDAEGFVGMANVLNSPTGDMVVDAGGSAANTGSSVYLIRAGEDDLSAVMIEDNPIELGETITQNVVTSDNKNMPAYYTPGCSWLGMQSGSKYSFGRICNLTAESGFGLTDDLVYKALEQFPSGRPPTHIVMSRRSLFQLRASRTAHNATGAPAPIPADVAGIPVVSTDALSNTEAILS